MMEERHKVDTRYECTLGKQLLSKAIAELNEPETNEERLQKIDKLRNAFVEQNKNLRLIGKNDRSILKYLRAKKFDHDQALNMMTNYHNQLQSWPEVSRKVEDPASVKYIFNAGSFVALRQKNYDGSTICIGRPGKSRTQTFTDFVATFIISFNRLLEEEEVQINGITLIQDLNYVNYNIIKQFPLIARRTIKLFEDSLPIRLKNLIFVRHSFFVPIIYAIMSPFMKEKLCRRIRLLGKNFEAQLHGIIDPSVLPPDYGGTGDDLDEHSAILWKNVVYGDDIFI